MRFPKYWVRGFAEGTNWSCWRWSDDSEDDARNKAIEAAQRLAARMESGGGPADHYPYGEGDRPLREEVLEEFPGADGELAGAITRNHYGCTVLNAARLMFVDIDFPERPRPEPVRRAGFLSRLFGRGGDPEPEPEAEVDPAEPEALGRLRRWIETRPGSGARAYRTAAGLRYLVTHAPLEADGEAVTTLEQLGSDPLYIRLCKAQRCFRARLSPKPWRVGHYSTHSSWPARPVKPGWIDAYDRKAASFATCALIETIGNPAIHPDLDALISRHDAECRVESGLPLA